MTDLERELSTNIEPELVKELLDDYQDLKKRYRLADSVPAVAAAGRLSEDTLKCIIYLKDQQVTSKMGLSFRRKYNEIINYPSPADTIEEYKFRLIPEVAKAVYTIRNKKRGQHARGEELLDIDLQYIVKACDWIIASLLYVSHGVPEDDALKMMSDILKYDVPLVEEIGGYSVLSRTDLDKQDALLVILYSFGGSAKQSVIARNLKIRYSHSATYNAIQLAHDDALIFRHPETKVLTLLKNGIRKAEEVIKSS
ncbi:MAG: hypothetical protein ACFFER_06155 [Candidatus Thorarchaeota archaeon]